jgi:hypothetical protein
MQASIVSAQSSKIVLRMRFFFTPKSSVATWLGVQENGTPQGETCGVPALRINS